MRIPWDELSESPTKAEQLFDLILHSVYGDRVITTNGAGGDGGIDAWIEDLGQAVEFKSFTKLGKSQRDQMVRSLKRAAVKNPRSWVLVAPVHATSGDRQWFASLAGRYPFTMTFHDVRWLESRLAERPDIARYVLTTPHQEALDLVRDLREEQAALLGGAPDLLTRLRVLRGWVDELSPVWGMNFVSHGDQHGIAVFPKPDSRRSTSLSTSTSTPKTPPARPRTPRSPTPWPTAPARSSNPATSPASTTTRSPR